MALSMAIKRLRSEWLILCASSLSVGSSLIAETLLHLSPCILCQVQRGLHVLLIPIALCWLSAPYDAMKLRLKKICLCLLALSALVAAYHTLVQWNWVQDRCKSSVEIMDAASYRALLSESPKGCSKSGWKWGKVPVSAMNAFLSLFLFISMYKNRCLEFGGRSNGDVVE